MKKIISIVILLLILLTSFCGCISSFTDIIIDDSYYLIAPRDQFTYNDFLCQEKF